VESGRSLGQSAGVSKPERIVVTLRFHGDDLDPEVVTERLGAPPSRAAAKGMSMTSANGIERTTKTGQWLLTTETASAAVDFDGPVRRMFDQLTSDEEVWRELSGRFSGNLFVGLFLGSSNDGFAIGPDVVRLIAARGLELQFDIYGPLDD
jgi:hypothetical protein